MGFPRTVNQAEALDQSLAAEQTGIDIVINLRVNDNVVLERITGRRSCPKCGAVYHVRNMPPKKDDVCDKDGTKLVQRPDDTEEVVQEPPGDVLSADRTGRGVLQGQRTVHDIDANGRCRCRGGRDFRDAGCLARKKGGRGSSVDAPHRMMKLSQMAITLRSRREIELMRQAGAVVADVLSKLQKIAQPGMTTRRPGCRWRCG